MDIFIYMVTAVIAGSCAILLVSKELSFISGIPKSGRYILAFFLSFGVLGFTIKTVAIGLLLQKNVMKTAVNVSKRTVEYIKQTDIEPRGLTHPSPGKEWKTLPMLQQELDPRKVELGKKLFFDKRLSSTGTISCASCHDILNGGDDAQKVSTGVNGLTGDRNAPTVINAVYMKRFFWDGRAKSLQDQAAGPLTNPVEMAMNSLDDVVKTVSDDPIYRLEYKKIYERPVSIDGITNSIAAFEKTLISNDSPYDRFVAGDREALNKDQLKGMILFDKIGCRNCHMDPTFSVAGIKHQSPFMPFPVFKKSPYLKKHDLLQDKGKGQNGAWRVPSLRNIELTSPYFHNGSVTDLSEAVRVMVTAQLGLDVFEETKDEFLVTYNENGPVVQKSERTINEEQIKQIVAFLKSLSGTPHKINDPWDKK